MHKCIICSIFFVSHYCTSKLFLSYMMICIYRSICLGNKSLTAPKEVPRNQCGEKNNTDLILKKMHICIIQQDARILLLQEMKRLCKRYSCASFEALSFLATLLTPLKCILEIASPSKRHAEIRFWVTDRRTKRQRDKQGQKK